MNGPKTIRDYEVVTGFFLQDEGSTVAYPVPPHLGLLDSSADRWSKFLSKLEALNNEAASNVSYKFIIAGRHGEGYHNLAQLKYGTKLWDDYWSKLDGDGEIQWGPDPLLTELGEEQARAASKLWKDELSEDLPLPTRFYCSPMTRALQTCRMTFEGIIDFEKQTPLILENCREIYGVHTCDKRRSATYIRKTFPQFALEDGFVEEDELYDPGTRETREHVTERARLVLDRVFSDAREDEMVISITAHNEFINGICRAIGHKPTLLITGGILPLIVRCTVS